MNTVAAHEATLRPTDERSLNQTPLILKIMSYRSDIKTSFTQDIYDDFEWHTADAVPTDGQPYITWSNQVWVGVKSH